jgi:putative hydrolase of the HAD superfamily
MALPLGLAPWYHGAMLRYLLLDLDNTLYPASARMEEDILRRMGEFAAVYLGTTPREAMEERRRQVRRYGTTLEWLMGERGFDDPERYFASIHPEGEEYCIEPDPDLGGILDSILLPKAVFTNAPREHAQRVLRKLGVADRFEAIYDIRFCALKGKPHADAFHRVCAACGVRPQDSLFVDDHPHYVEGFIAVGGNAILIDEADRHADLRLRRIHSLAELPGIVRELDGPSDRARP